MSVDLEKLRKRIFECKLTGDPIAISYCDTSGAEREEIKKLLWRTGVLTVFAPHKYITMDQLAGYYTHPVRYIDYDYPPPEGNLKAKGETFCISRRAHKLLISGEDS